MSFGYKESRKDSDDTAKLRAEYLDKVRQMKESHDPATKAKLKDVKQAAFQRVVQQMNGERREELKKAQQVFAKMGRYKTDDQLKAERAQAEAAKAAKVSREQRA
jgi:hypothetical protein